MIKNVMSFLGIDLAANPKNETGIALIEGGSFKIKPRLLRTNIVYSNKEIIEEVRKSKPIIVAIDAPLTIPQGKVGKYTDRISETLMREMGIKIFSPPIIAPLVFRGIHLKEEISKELLKGRVIEVYPRASIKRMNIWVSGRKKSNNTRKLLQKKLGKYVDGLPNNQIFDDHTLDAIISAYTAYCHYFEKSEFIGDPGEGCIIIPKL